MKKVKRIEKMEKKLDWNDDNVKGAKMRHQLLEGLMALPTG